MTTQDEETNQDQDNAWQTIQRSHAVANGVPVISVNRVGFAARWSDEVLGRLFCDKCAGKIVVLSNA